ncbi:MAG: hypothetical protein MR286_10685 [Clostridiales bacterium]|nr:hypothetical protein [Clostridiales bacterium]
MTMHFRLLALIILHFLPLLFVLLTWKRPYEQAKPTILWGQAIASVCYMALLPMCVSLDFGGRLDNSLLEDFDPLYLFEFWTGEGSLHFLFLFSAIVVTGLLLALRKKLKPE